MSKLAAASTYPRGNFSSCPDIRVPNCGKGKIVWVKDYGAPDNPDRTMYAEIAELTRFVRENLNQ